MRLKPAIVAAAAAFLLGSVAQAHVGLFTFERLDNSYFIDIGANTLTFKAGELALFEYNLYPNTDPNNLAGFDNVYVTIGDDQSTLLSTFVHRPAGTLTVLSYIFPKEGEYQMSARFQKGDEVMSQAAFPIQVGKRDGWQWAYAWPLGGLLAGIALAGAGQSFRKRRPTPALD